MVGHVKTPSISPVPLLPRSWTHMACSARAPRVLVMSTSCYRARPSFPSCLAAPHSFSQLACATPPPLELSRARQLTARLGRSSLSRPEPESPPWLLRGATPSTPAHSSSLTYLL